MVVSRANVDGQKSARKSRNRRASRGPRLFADPAKGGASQKV